jgi:hypothetical protein
MHVKESDHPIVVLKSLNGGGAKGMGKSTESNCQLGNQEELSLNVYVWDCEVSIG